MPHKEPTMPPARPNLQIKTSQAPPHAPAGSPPRTQTQTQTQTHDAPSSNASTAQRASGAPAVQAQNTTQAQTAPPLATRHPPTTPSHTAPAPAPAPAPNDDPPAPPHSPISPSNIAASLASMPPFSAPAVLAHRPPPVPLADSDNMDVIALRSAASLLQLQAATARRDVQALVKMREAALQDPEAFVRATVARERGKGAGVGAGAGAGGGKRDGAKEDLLAPTLGYLVQGLGEDAELLKAPDVEMRDAPSAPPNTAAGDKNASATAKASPADGDASDSDDSSATPPRFPTPPRAQNVYRMPPINWAKYHVVGGGLEKLHAEQTARPTPGVPLVDGQQAQQDAYVLAAPYAPVADAGRVMGTSSEHPMQTRRGLRKQ